MLYHGVVPGTAVNLRRKRGEHHETGIRQTVTCNHLTLARVCKTIDWQQPLPRCGEYVTGLDTLDGEQELQVHKLLHRAQDGSCLAELPGFNIAQLRLSYRELEQLAEKKGWTLQKL